MLSEREGSMDAHIHYVCVSLVQNAVYTCCAYVGKCEKGLCEVTGETDRRFQTRASPGIARVKFWSIVLIAYHYIVLRDEAKIAKGEGGRIYGTLPLRYNL